MEIIREAQRQENSQGSSTIYSNPMAECDLDNFDCPVCGNKGYIVRTDEDGILWSRDCECMKKRISLRRLADSGLQEMVKRYRFDNYQTPDAKLRMIRDRALEFAISSGECFIISGQSGSGKTHICTAICNELIERNWKVRYMIWRTDAAKLKSIVNNPEEYEREINRLRNTPVLYIDDFFKGTVSSADVNLAFTILNDRYNSRGKKTIISTERSMEELLEIDEAIGGRIAERAKGYIIQAPKRNWRL